MSSRPGLEGKNAKNENRKGIKGLIIRLHICMLCKSGQGSGLQMGSMECKGSWELSDTCRH